MKNTKENRDRIHENSVVQISFDDDAGFRGCFMIVHSVLTWGVQGWVPVPGAGSNPALYGVPWDRLEPTNGVAAWGANGVRIIPIEKTKHHP